MVVRCVHEQFAGLVLVKNKAGTSKIFVFVCDGMEFELEIQLAQCFV